MTPPGEREAGYQLIALLVLLLVLAFLSVLARVQPWADGIARNASAPDLLPGEEGYP